MSNLSTIFVLLFVSILMILLIGDMTLNMIRSECPNLFDKVDSEIRPLKQIEILAGAVFSPCGLGEYSWLVLLIFIPIGLALLRGALSISA